MAYEAYVLLPGDATWPDLALVRVLSRTDVELLLAYEESPHIEA